MFEGATSHYKLELHGPPIAMPRPTMAAWLVNGGVLKRRVWNKRTNERKSTGPLLTKQLKDKYRIENNHLPMCPNGPVKLTLTFYRRPPNNFESRAMRDSGFEVS